MLWVIRAVALALGLAFAAPAAVQADAVAKGQEIAARAIAAAEAGDNAKAADLFGEALTLRPNHPGLTRRLATASARAGRKGAAIAALQAYAAMGLNTDIAADPDLASLAGDPRLDAVRARFVENAKPKGALSIAATVAEPQVLAEGIALEPVTGRMFIAAVHKRKIIVVKNGIASDFVTTGGDGLWGAFGVALDEPRGSLWVASSALPHAAGLAAAEKGRAGLFEFALADARLKRKVLTPTDGKEHVFGDLVVTKSGDVFVSDSTSPVIYRLGSGASALEEFARSDEFHSLQGLALSADGKKLAVADYSSGVHVFDVATRARTRLAMPRSTTLHGIDGLVRHGRDLVGIQNGIDPQRAILVRMNKTWSAIETVEVLAANLPEMDEPTLATKAGRDLLVIGNGQWSRFEDDGAVKAGASFAPTRIVRLALPPERP